MTTPSPNNYDIAISTVDERLNADLDRLEAHVRRVLERFGVKQAHVDIAIVDDPGIEEIHAQYLDDPTPTDVISFDLSDGPDAEERVFEIVVNAAQAAREAAKRGHALEAELALYITHGLLHNLGCDDLDPDAAAQMHRMEDELLEDGGYGPVYHESK